jgi:hypothetical protein
MVHCPRETAVRVAHLFNGRVVFTSGADNDGVRTRRRNTGSYR